MEYSKILLFVGIITIGMISESYGHSYVTSPQSRSNQRQTQSGCRGPNCLGPCDTPLANSKGPVATYQRGDKVTVQWPRNNHAGGFIRFAWALTSNSDSASAFDTGVQQINCHEVGGCGPSNPSDPNGGDDGAGDGSYKPCQSTITVPGNLADGKWTLQWAWFGGAFALGDYYSCIDVTISGGAYSTSSPVFVGGDYANPGTQKCKFFNTNKLHQCLLEPCDKPLFSGQQTGVPAYLQVNLDGSIIPVTIGVSTPTPAPAQPVTSTSSSTTSKAPVQSSTSTSTTGSVRPPSTSTSSTSAKTPVPSTPSSPATPSTPSSNTCSAGQMKCVDSEQFAMCVFGTWGSSMRCAPSTTCRPFGDVIQCGW